MEWAWLCGGFVPSLVQEMRFAVVSAVLYSCLVESVAVWVLCFNCGMSCGLPVSRLRIGVPESPGGSYVGVVSPSVLLAVHCSAIMKTLGFRGHTP